MMKSKRIPISIEEFELMEHPFGWKAEYFDGKAHLTPREHLVRTQLILAPQKVTTTHQIVPVDPLQQERMILAFLEAFEDSVEFCDWSSEAFHTHARKNITNYFQEKRGKPHPVSRMVLEPHSDPLSEGLCQRIIGLALFVENKAESVRRGFLTMQPTQAAESCRTALKTIETTAAEERVELDLLLVLPEYQRTGIATEMVAGAIDSLYADGVRDLRSGYHICNDRSRAWHHSLGFKDVPDYFYCRLKAGWYRHEIWRWEKLGQIDSAMRTLCERLEELRTEKDRWERLVQELEMCEPF
jgi:GNAT superfamily N-acetyltransferase